MSKQNQNNQNHETERNVKSNGFFKKHSTLGTPKNCSIFGKPSAPVYDFDYSVNIFFNKYISYIYSELAQLAEHLTVNQVVAGSSPAFGAKTKADQIGLLLFCPNAGYSPATAGSFFAATPVVWSRDFVLFKLASLPTLWRKLRQKQYSIVFILVSQHSEPTKKD